MAWVVAGHLPDLPASDPAAATRQIAGSNPPVGYDPVIMTYRPCPPVGRALAQTNLLP